MDDKVTLLSRPLTRRSLLRGSLTILAGSAAFVGRPGAVPAQAASPVALQLGWFANAQMAGDFTAIGKGYFKEVGLDVKIVPGGPSIDPVGVVASGSVLIGNVATIGVQGTARPLLDAVLAKYQVPRDKVNVIIVGGTTTPLLTKQADVVTGWVINYAQNLPIEGKSSHFLLWDLGIRMYAYTYFTTDQVYNTKKDVLTRYVAAAAKGWLYAKDHPEEAVDYVLKSASGLERDMEVPTWKVSIPYISSPATQQWGWGYMDPQVWGSLSDTYASLDQIPRKVTPDEIMSNEIVLAAKTPKF